MPVAKAEPTDAPPPDPLTILRSRSYVMLLVMAALVGVPISAMAFGFLALVDELQPLLYTDLPEALGFHGTPPWWPLPLLAVGGLLAGLRCSTCRDAEATNRPVGSRPPARPNPSSFLVSFLLPWLPWRL